MPRELHIRHFRLSTVRIDNHAVVDTQLVRRVKALAAELRNVVVLLDTVAADAQAADETAILI
jgi:hypothetical protein